MAAFLLSWNPKLLNWRNIDEDVDSCNRGEVVTKKWSCGNNKRIAPGDRVFFIRVDSEPRGIFAYGTAISPSYEDEHWSDPSKTARFIECQLDSIVNPDVGPIISRARLNQEPFAGVHWSSQIAGISIRSNVALSLQEEWSRLNPDSNFALPDEILTTSEFLEGAKRVVIVNSYERSNRAREACIAEYGTRCVVCSFDFAEKYGPIGDGYIHVHHLTPVSDAGGQYKIDAIKDLRPVCPNCHAIIHRRSPPYTIEEVKGMIET